MARLALAASALAACALLTGGEAPRCPPRRPCAERGDAMDEFFYEVRGRSLRIVYREAQYFHLACVEGVGLEDAALPAFRSEALVPQVKLTACAPPEAGYERALRALNVTAVRALDLAAVPALPALSAGHLRGLSLLRALAVTGAEPLRPAADWLRGRTGLLDLRLDRVPLSPAALLELPADLESFFYVRFDGGELPAAALARLPRLARLAVKDDRLRALDAAAAPALVNLSATGPLAGIALGPSVRRLELRDARSLQLTGDCSGLRAVRVQGAASAPPASWLARCAGVRELELWGMPAGTVGADELAGAGSLRRLVAVRCGLAAVSPRWLADARGLHELDVSHNRLERLPSSLPLSLESLVAVDNRMGSAAVATLGALPALRELALDRNPLADLCGDSDSLDPNDLQNQHLTDSSNDLSCYSTTDTILDLQNLRPDLGLSGIFDTTSMSPLHGARELRRLSLRATGVRHVCRDWRSGLPRLAALDLRDNRIAALGPADLEWRREAPATVDLRGNAVSVLYTRADYEAALLALPAPDAPVTALLMDSDVRCDCSDYWFARALRERPGHVRATLVGLRCATDGAAVPLRDVPLIDLACDVPQAQGCPERCRCRATGEAAELRCERAGLTAVPRAPLLPPPRLLLLAGNNISRVSPEDVPPSLELLDLRDNGLSRLEPALLGANAPRLMLAGNPLDCSCAALPAMRALAGGAHRVLNASAVLCADGRRATDAAARAVADCVRLTLWPAALAALALAVASAAVAAYLARPAVRHRLKRFLFERGLCLPWLLRPLGADEERQYDAFVSYSQRDRRYAYELARRLEKGAARRLCLHERDWVPGEWISEQIARSVRRSRRTLVLLSDHFLASTWALAEMREAYDAALREERPRLLLLLLPELTEPKAHADQQLRAYLASVTYLRWEEPRFWEKLSLALPPRSPPAPPAPPAATPPPPPP